PTAPPTPSPATGSATASSPGPPSARTDTLCSPASKTPASSSPSPAPGAVNNSRDSGCGRTGPASAPSLLTHHGPGFRLGRDERRTCGDEMATTRSGPGPVGIAILIRESGGRWTGHRGGTGACTSGTWCGIVEKAESTAAGGAYAGRDRVEHRRDAGGVDPAAVGTVRRPA